MRHPKVWYAVTDGGRARILEKQSAKEPFSLQHELLSSTLHTPSRNLGTERPGRSHESASTTRHAMQPRSDPHQNGKDAFVRKVAQKLNEASGRGEFDLLVLAAPPYALRVLNKTLDTATQDKIAGRLQKDLTKLPLDALESHFRPLQLDISAKWH